MYKPKKQGAFWAINWRNRGLWWFEVGFATPKLPLANVLQLVGNKSKTVVNVLPIVGNKSKTVVNVLLIVGNKSKTVVNVLPIVGKKSKTLAGGMQSVAGGRFWGMNDGFEASNQAFLQTNDVSFWGNLSILYI